MIFFHFKGSFPLYENYQIIKWLLDKEYQNLLLEKAELENARKRFQQQKGKEAFYSFLVFLKKSSEKKIKTNRSSHKHLKRFVDNSNAARSVDHGEQ